MTRPAGPAPSAARRMALGLMPMFLLDVALPLVAFNVLSNHGWSTRNALVVGSAFPILASLVSLLRSRSVDGLAVITLIFIAIGIAASTVSGSGQVYLAKESAIGGVAGLVFAASLVAPRPLAFYFGRQFATAGDPAKVAAWNGYWAYPQFRRVQYVVTAAWAMGLIAAAVLQVIVVLVLPISTSVWLSSVVAYGSFVLLLAWMFPYISRHRNRAEAAGIDLIA